MNCDDQKEVDRMWDALSKGGGQKGQCGWLKDRFGVSWQVAPRVLTEMIAGRDHEASNRVFATVLKMKKLVVSTGQQVTFKTGTQVNGGLFFDDVDPDSRIEPLLTSPERISPDPLRTTALEERLRQFVLSPWTRSQGSVRDYWSWRTNWLAPAP